MVHAYTYSAHPAGCAVALRTIQFIEEHDLMAEAARKGAYLLEGLRARLGTHPHVGEIRGKGLMCAAEFARDAAARTDFAPEEHVGARVHAEAQARGLFSRIRGDVYLLAPPYITPDDLLDRMADIVADSTRAVRGSLSCFAVA